MNTQYNLRVIVDISNREKDYSADNEVETSHKGNLLQLKQHGLQRINDVPEDIVAGPQNKDERDKNREFSVLDGVIDGEEDLTVWAERKTSNRSRMGTNLTIASRAS